jgi:hypothetical protein
VNLFGPHKYTLLEILFANGKKIRMRGEVKTFLFWVEIENNEEIISINREKLIMIKEKKS